MLRETTDPIMAMLSRLPPMDGDTRHDVRVRARCHAILQARRTNEMTKTPRFTDLLLAGATALYVLASLGEAARLIAGR